MPIHEVHQERLSVVVKKDSSAQVDQERLVAAVTQATNARIIQEHLTAAVTQATHARVVQERLIIAMLPGRSLGLMTLRQSSRMVGVPSQSGIAL